MEIFIKLSLNGQVHAAPEMGRGHKKENLLSVDPVLAEIKAAGKKPTLPPPLTGFVGGARGGTVAGIVSYLCGQRRPLRELSAVGKAPKFSVIGYLERIDHTNRPGLETVYETTSFESNTSGEDLTDPSLSESDFQPAARIAAEELKFVTGATSLGEAAASYVKAAKDAAKNGEQAGSERAQSIRKNIEAGWTAGATRGSILRKIAEHLDKVTRENAAFPPIMAELLGAIVDRASRDEEYRAAMVEAEGNLPYVGAPSSIGTTHTWVAERRVLHGMPRTMIKAAFDVYIAVSPDTAEKIAAGPMMASYGEGGAAVPTFIDEMEIPANLSKSPPKPPNLGTNKAGLAWVKREKAPAGSDATPQTGATPQGAREPTPAMNPRKGGRGRSKRAKQG